MLLRRGLIGLVLGVAAAWVALIAHAASRPPEPDMPEAHPGDFD